MKHDLGGWSLVFTLLLSGGVLACAEEKLAAPVSPSAPGRQKVIPRVSPTSGSTTIAPDSRMAEVGWHHIYRINFSGRMRCATSPKGTVNTRCEGGIVQLVFRQGKTERVEYADIPALGTYSFDIELKAPETGLVDWTMSLRTLSGNEWQQQGQMVLLKSLDMTVTRDWVIPAP